MVGEKERAKVYVREWMYESENEIESARKFKHKIKIIIILI